MFTLMSSKNSPCSNGAVWFLTLDFVVIWRFSGVVWAVTTTHAESAAKVNVRGTIF